MRLRLAALGLMMAGVCQAASPHLEAIDPPGIQRGAESEITISGGHLEDVRGLLFYEPGIELESVQGVDGGKAKAKLKVAADCTPGEHDLRVWTATGISELLPIYVGPFPNVAANKQNHDAKHAQAVPMNSTVNGVIDNEEIDYFSVQATKGRRITAEVEGLRLGREMFDPWVAILDAQGRQLAFNDDNPLLLQDPLTSILAPADGTYLVAVRESTWGGSSKSAYRLHIGSFPQPLAVYPAGGPAGQDLAVTFLGDIKGPIAATVKLPAVPGKFAAAGEDGGPTAPAANRLRVSAFPNVLEQLPNGEPAHATATDLPLPVAFNGILHETGAKGFFRFHAKKGQALDLTVFARQVGSPLDSVMAICDATGRQLAENDDSIGQDSYLRFNVPADGDYLVSVRDQLSRGGPTYVYRVEVRPGQPDVSFTMPEVVKDTQERETIVVPRGNRYAAMLRLKKADVDGDPGPAIGDLPAGLSMKLGTPSGDSIPVLFEADGGANPAAKLCEVKAQATGDGKSDRPLQAGYEQEVELVHGSPNQTVYFHTEIDRLAVSVAEEAPFKLTLVQPKAPLVQNGSGSLKVVAERKPGFTGAITVSMLYNPNGLGSQATAVIPEKQNEVQLPISANDNAKTRTWQVAVIGSGDAGRGTTWAASDFVTLEVAKPFVTAHLERADTEQGQPATIACSLEQNTPFEGKAHIKIVNLPNTVTAQELDFGPGDKTLTFNVKTEAKSPAGKHKDLFCQLTFQKAGETITENTGFGGVLRIDKPAGKGAGK